MTALQRQVYFYSDNETLCYHFRHDDRVGVYIQDVPVAIPCFFNQATRVVHARTENSSVPFQLGETATFDNLNLPYECSVEAYVDTVDNLYLNDTRDWVPCPHSIIPVELPSRGSTGYTGPVGATGPRGDRGPAGLPGLPGAPSNTSAALQTSSESSVMNVVFLVWLCVLTIVVVIVILLLVYLHAVRRGRSSDDVVDVEATARRSDIRIFSTKRNRTPSTIDDVVSLHSV